MLKLKHVVVVIPFLIIQIFGQCPRIPSIYHSKVDKIPGDNGYQIKVNENPDTYVPGKLYTLYLMGLRTFDKIQHFTRFKINVQSTKNPEMISPQNVGSFQLYADNLSTFDEGCINSISEKNDLPKTEVFFMWSAPPPGSGCVTFKGSPVAIQRGNAASVLGTIPSDPDLEEDFVVAMVFEHSARWYADDGGLSKTFCEQTDKDVKHDENECCACDEAKYGMIFEGIWSKQTHPKDFPFSLWLTHFSDVIGASHERNFRFWGEGQIATEGFRSLAEWGSVRLLETELRAKAKYLRTIIKAAGLWYPQVNTNTSANFRVDRRHHVISLASMFGPTPDWVVGVSGLNLCLKNCTWIENMEIDLYPYDAGTDSGVSYMSPNAETNPRERMYRITTTYPEDPRAPFYDPTRKEMPPLAKLYLKREKLIPKNCDENFLNAQLDLSENTEDTTRPECAVTEYTAWSDCSVTCGKGLRMRTREYRMPQKAKMFGCNRQLVSKEMCVAAIPECVGGQATGDTSLEEQPIEELPGPIMGVCETSPWSSWSSCSSTCGIGFKMRTRFFVDKMGRKKCPHVSTVEKEKCMGPACTGGPQPPQEVQDPMCPTTEWSDWSPCSVSCGKGVRLRTQTLLVEPALEDKCKSRMKLIQEEPCMDMPECTFDMATIKVICMQDKDQGLCDGYFNRWYFDVNQKTCLSFAYGGCRGNKNNFLTFQECMETCSVVKDALLGQTPTPPAPRTARIEQNQQIRNPNTPYVSSTLNRQQPVDCMVTPWTPWSPCNVSCGEGFQERFRMVKRQPENGGTPCPTKLTRRKKCWAAAACHPDYRRQPA